MLNDKKVWRSPSLNGLLVAASLLLVSNPLPAMEPSGARKPNIIVVLIDDMGWGDFSCFGNREVKTEAIDALSAEGLRFEQFCVNSPICSPSRAAILTGQYPQRWRITSFLNNRKSNEQRGMAQWLDVSAPVLARGLKQAGYATGHFGKWHLGGQRDVGDAPLITDYGFDESLTNFEGLGDRVLPMLDAYDGKPAKKHSLGSENLGRGKITWEERSKVTSSFVGHALHFIEQAAAKDQPFFVDVWPDDVHSPFFPPAALRGDRSKHQLYSGVLKATDAQLAPLFDYVRSHEKLRNNTLILLFSDNGPEPGAGSAGPFRGHKGTLYEGGIRSSLIVWSPALLNPAQVGKVNETSFLAAFDLAPSLLKLAGAEAPSGVHFDGEQSLDVLLGKSTAPRGRPVFFRRPPDRPSDAGKDLPDLAVRDGNWKLLCRYDGSNAELYDLTTDRGEAKNLAAKNPELVKRLTDAALTWHGSMPPDRGAELRSAATDSQPDRAPGVESQ